MKLFLPVMTENPARLLGLFENMGSIEAGKEANLVVLDQNCDVARTFVDGVECTGKG